MNRRNRGQAKRIEFEPRIPQETVQPAADIPPEGKNEESSRDEEVIHQIKGMLAPKTFSSPADFDIGSYQFVLNLPDTFENCSLLVFEDGTLGIKMDGTVYECDASFIGDGMAVEVGDTVKKLGECDFILTAYDYEKR